MSERKQTPNVLADILGDAAPAMDVLPPVAAASKKPAARRTARAEAPKAKTESKPVNPVSAGVERVRWEYLSLSLQNYRGWRVRFWNGMELTDWMYGPLWNEYLNELGQQGWEMCAACAGEPLYASSDRMQMYFKRTASGD